MANFKKNILINKWVCRKPSRVGLKFQLKETLMKVFRPSIFLILFSIFISSAQNSSPVTTNPFPTISNLTNWAAFNSQSKFDLAIRSFGFKFEVKSVEATSTAYTYIRKVTVKEIDYTDRIVYRIANNNSASIISLVTASTDLVSLYTPQLATFKNNDCKTEMSKDKNTTCSCYSSSEFAIDVCDERVKLTMGDGNKYFISVAKN